MLGGRFLSRSGNWPPPADRVAFYAARHGLKSMNKNEEGHVRPPSRVLARPICAVKAVFFNVKVSALHFCHSKSYFHDLHFHPVVTDPCEKPEKAADRRVSQIVVTQHIAATCDLQTSVPRADFLGGIRNRKICPHIPDFAVLSHVFAIIFTAVRLAASKTSTLPGKASAIPRTSSRTCWVRK